MPTPGAFVCSNARPRLRAQGHHRRFRRRHPRRPKAGLAGTSCRGDVFHVLHEITPLVTFLENRAYDVITTHAKLYHKKTKLQSQAVAINVANFALARKMNAAAAEQAKAIALADDVALLAHWLRHDLFAVSGLPYADRVALFDFIVAELQARAAALSASPRSGVHAVEKSPRPTLGLRRATRRGFDQARRRVRGARGHRPCTCSTSRPWTNANPSVGKRRRPCGNSSVSRFHCSNKPCSDLRKQVVRASSIIENINSRLRSYFFLRREMGSGYLELVQFFLNHRRFLRSEHAERVDKSPAELLTGQSHPHWLEMLGYHPILPELARPNIAKSTSSGSRVENPYCYPKTGF